MSAAGAMRHISAHDAISVTSGTNVIVTMRARNSLMMHTTYNGWLVALSVAVAVLVSYTALRLADHLSDARPPVRPYRIGSAAAAMGIGIWSMHFIGMLAMSMPIVLHYDLTLTLLSLLIAVVISWLAIWIAATRRGAARLALGGVIMGCGIASMHYLGMAAIDITPRIQYQPAIVAASVVAGIGASWGALWLAFRAEEAGLARRLRRVGGPVLMGLAISSTHYIGMAAMRIAPGAQSHGGLILNSAWCSVTIASVAASILAFALLTDVYNAELATRARAHAGRLRQINARLRHQMRHDSLTGLANRDAFIESLSGTLQQVRAGRDRFAVLALDLDRFKLINDSLGHGAGDTLLCEVARRLVTAVRPGDLVARMSGDEFLILARPVRDAEDAGAIASRIIQGLGKPLRLDSVEVLVSSSIGISLYPDDGDTPEQLLAHADEAMYAAKRRGGRTFERFVAGMNGYAQERLWLEAELHHALARGQFQLHYQPRVDVLSGQICSVEALLRWRHPSRGNISPRTFIPIAEETGLILPIGEWVLQEACRQARRWQLTGLPMRIAVNLSALQFRQRDLLHTIGAALSAHHAAPELLELEITESAVMSDAEASVAILEQLSRMGVVVAVDDFGTGYSNMSYLRRFPIDRLKIDSSFVSEMSDDPQSTLIVQAIISLAHSLRMKVVAEGVETPAQLERLAELGCDQYQGFLFGQPSPAAVIEPQLRAQAAYRECADPAATHARLARPAWALAHSDDTVVCGTPHRAAGAA